MTLSRSKPLTSRRDCDWECTGVTSGGWKKWECENECGNGRITPPGEEPPPSRCKGLSRSSGPKRTSRPKPISPDRDRKRRSRGVRGPLCDYVRGLKCAVPGCSGRSDPAHVDSVGSGHGDWQQVGDPGSGVRWAGRVANLCRGHHRKYDGDVGGGSGEAFERRHGIDVAQVAAERGEAFASVKGIDLTSEKHPYRQIGWTP